MWSETFSISSERQNTAARSLFCVSFMMLERSVKECVWFHIIFSQNASHSQSSKNYENLRCWCLWLGLLFAWQTPISTWRPLCMTTSFSLLCRASLKHLCACAGCIDRHKRQPQSEQQKSWKPGVLMRLSWRCLSLTNPLQLSHLFKYGKRQK